MDSLKATYMEEEDDEQQQQLPTTIATSSEIPQQRNDPQPTHNGLEAIENQDLTKKQQQDHFVSASESLSESDPTTSNDTEKRTPRSQKTDELDEEEDEDDDDDEDPPPKKQKQLSSLTNHCQQEPETPIEEGKAKEDDCNDGENNVGNKTKVPTTTTQAAAKKKSKKKNSNNVWVSRSTRKGKKKSKPNTQNTPAEEKVLITPVPRFPDRSDDSPDMKICLSKVYKAEKVELSEDRMSAGSTKGYRMVRATRGVCEGAWYFEIKVVNLGETGHTRLGWSTEKGDLQAPVGYDANSFGYRDTDGSKVHKALREKYGEEGYKEGDVIGFYINLPEGTLYTPKPPHLVWYKGQRYVRAPDAKDDPPKIVPGSEISFYRNGVCQGVAFKDLYGGRYYPAASMYTLPNQPNCVVKFNFGPDFEFFPEDLGGRSAPKPMVEVPYLDFDR
ncbi:hypothetical protein K2173_016297 [Erythroxylum novogranatense]|uniref:B30.2/SPRY domain-containing protein n=1 Tax=Erythroxylum novogranatense TaxID=1862640 RepID=A0AAV8SFU4_9ROSI|nr:hypothetical protein K2173_016297 [Erythroxylum novogranatense]